MKQLMIIGGGAAGLAAALSARKSAPQLEITVLERLDRVGKKILATGNGRCNLTNSTASPSHYYSSSWPQLKEAMTDMPPKQVLAFFEELGLLCQEEDEGRIYPYCKQASMVVDVLLQALERAGIRVRCGTAITGICREKGRFLLKTAEGETLSADAVILATGGKAAPKLGSDGSGFVLATALGHSCTALYPALVALKCDMHHHGGLKGIRAEAGLTLLAGKRELGRERGEIQFAEYGLSGIPVMQLSGRLARLKNGERCTALVDLFPDLTAEALFRLLKKRQQQDLRATLETLLLGTIHKRLAYAVLKTAGLHPLSRNTATLTNSELHHLAELLKAWPFVVTGTQGWEFAQVTGGGIPLTEIDTGTMMSGLRSGLYLAGEVLDVAGDCGGFNLHWAWCSGIRAGTAAGEALNR